MAKQNPHDDDAVDPSADDSDPNKTKKFDTVEGDDEFDLASVDRSTDESDPNKTKKFDASRKTVEGDEFELDSIDPSTDDSDPNKTKKFEASRKTVEGDEFELDSVDPSTDDSDPNKTKKFDASRKTVEGNGELELGSVDPDDSVESSEQHTPDLATGEERVGLQTVVLGTGQTLANDSAGNLETGEDLNEKTIIGAVDRPILPGTIMADDIAPLSSSEFDQSFDSSQELDDSRGNSVGSASRAWGKQNTNVTPMSSIEAPLRSRRTMVQPKLNDRLVVADGEAETVGNPDYRIISFLGAGAMGEVYIARQTSVDRDVAFKKQILKKKESRRKMIRNRDKFLFEAQITANLDHPNIVGIHDMGRDQNGDVFYCMELVRGEPWEDVIRKMTLKDNLEVLLKVIDGVAYAHSKDTIHRDLKPENTMLGEFGEVLIMDWGLGVNLSNGPPQTMGGTPGFMAPEMATREEIVGKHSDVYLLGAILFVITTGQTPHTGIDVWKCLDNAKINRIVDVSDSPKQFDKRLLAIAHKAMETDPKDRYANPEQLRSAIENYQSNQLSIELAERSEVELKSAVENQDYEFFSKSMFGFRESVSLWNENAVAESGLQRAKIGYATCALERQDFELGMSLLDPKEPEEAPLYQKLRKGAAASIQRRRLVWLACGASILLLAALVLTSMLNARAQKLTNDNLAKAVKRENKAKLKAEKETMRAVSATAKAEEETKKAEKEKKKAESATVAAEEQKKKAEAAAIKEEVAREKAERLADEKEKQRLEADKQRLEAEKQEKKSSQTCWQITGKRNIRAAKIVSIKHRTHRRLHS